MKRRFILIVVAIIFVSCNQPYIPRTIESIVIVEYKIDSVYGTPELAVRTLSDWAYAEVLKFDKDSCYSTMHSWEA